MLTSRLSLTGRLLPCFNNVPYSFDHYRLVETGDWTIQELIKYLLSLQPPLQPTDIERLRHVPAFLEETTTIGDKNEGSTPKKAPKFKASELYEPLDVFRDLGLPVVEWRGENGECEWKADSKEGMLDTALPPYILTLPSPAMFILKLGLKRYPPMAIVLSIAAKGEPQRTAALNYFLENRMQKYKGYSANAYANIAFVPAIRGGEKILAKPLEVFSNPDWQLLGFTVLDPGLEQAAAGLLQIKAHPPTNQLVRLLEVSPPTTEAQACKWFGVLSYCRSGLCIAWSNECMY